MWSTEGPVELRADRLVSRRWCTWNDSGIRGVCAMPSAPLSVNLRPVSCKEFRTRGATRKTLPTRLRHSADCQRPPAPAGNNRAPAPGDPIPDRRPEGRVRRRDGSRALRRAAALRRDSEPRPRDGRGSARGPALRASGPRPRGSRGRRATCATVPGSDRCRRRYRDAIVRR